jgi:hypothetical protein
MDTTQTTTEIYYRLSTGGGTAPLAPTSLLTAAEVRAWATRQNKCLSDADRAALCADVDQALAAGSGHGSAGSFARGTAAGMSVLRWQIERVTPTGPDAYGYLVAGGTCRYVGRAATP